MSIVATPRRPAVALKRFFFPALPHIQTGTHFNIPSLDGIRAVSILMVVVSHCGLGKWVPGGFGVTIFFFLSGYLITTLMRREHAKTGTLSLNDFYIRRCLRILPPSFIVIAISLLLALIFHETLSWVGVFANVAYFTNYYECFGGRSDIPGLNILWSLAVEEHFYMVFPLLYLLTCHTSRSRQGTLLVSLCAWCFSGDVCWYFISTPPVPILIGHTLRRTLGSIRFSGDVCSRLSATLCSVIGKRSEWLTGG